MKLIKEFFKTIFIDIFVLLYKFMKIIHKKSPYIFVVVLLLITFIIPMIFIPHGWHPLWIPVWLALWLMINRRTKIISNAFE